MSEFAVFEPRPPGARLTAGDGLIVRAAVERDAETVGAIAAAREGGDAETHAAAFLRLLDRGREGDAVFVAALAAEVVGFGKAHAFAPPAEAPPNAAPRGWYLAGVVVTPAHRRRGIGAALTAERLRWIAARAPVAFYFANARNAASIALHEPFGFVERTRDFWFPGATFQGGVGILFEAKLEG
jgi:ribosomal protein S18 acetylase RimI-like enzyme